MSDEKVNTGSKESYMHWRPSYAIYLSVIAAIVVTLVMMGSYMQYLKILRAIDDTHTGAFGSEFGYGAMILIGFVDILIILGGVLIYTIQRRRKYSEDLDDLLKELRDSTSKYDSIHERYDLITENITDVILTTDMQGNITYITPSIEAYLGISSEKLIGKKFDDFITKKSVKVLHRDIISRRQNPDKFKEVTTNELEIKGKDDHNLWVELKMLGYTKKGQQSGYLSVFRDVTQRRKSERYLRFQTDVLYNISDEVNMIDLDGKIIYVNKAVLKDLKVTKEEILGRTKSLLLPDPEYNISKEDIIKWVKENGHWEGIVGNYLPDGRRRIVSSRSKLIYDEDKHPIGIVSISTNITKKIEMEKDLKQSESKYRLLISNVSDVIWTSDKDFKITFITRSVEELLGYDSNEILSLKNSEYMTPDTMEKIEKISSRVKNKFNNISYPIVFNAEMICKDRTRKWAEAKINPLIEDDGTVSGFVGVWRDITSFIVTTDRNKALEERLSQSEKMEALGRLAGGVAHDLNNVLTGIVAYPDLLLIKLPEDDPLRKKVMAIKKSGQKAAAIVEDLLSLSRRGVNKFTPLNLNELIKDILDSPEVEKLKVYHPEVSYKFSKGDNVPVISGAQYQISKVMINLLTNASEAMQSGGNVYISTRMESSSDNTIKYKNVPDGDYAVISVSDEGVGISKADQKRIYEPFFTSKVMGKSGTGLGMAVVWGTVQDHNGYIEMKSKIGEGTTFDLYLPALSEAEAFESDIEDKTSISGHGEKILVLDDDPIQLEIAESLFRELNYNVKTVNEHENIINEIDIFEPDIFVMDMILSDGTDGLDVYKIIREKHKNLKVVIISGFSESERVLDALKLGVRKFISKPFTIQEIGRGVREVLDQKK
jgi:PAS domain S-box-containing protein